MNHRSYYPTYFSIEDIMVTQEKVPCKTNVVFPRLGFLSPDNEEEDLNKDTSLNVPVWLAQKLLQKRVNLIRVEVPNVFKEKARDVFEADATVVNLFRVNPNFFEFGLCFSRLKHRESELVKELLVKVFRKRFKLIFDWSINRMTEPSKIHQLDFSEQRLLKAGQKASELLEEWFVEAQFKMKPAEMVVGLKKRKLLCCKCSFAHFYMPGWFSLNKCQSIAPSSGQSNHAAYYPESLLANGLITQMKKKSNSQKKST